MLCKNRITLIGFLGQDAESRSTPNGNAYTRFSLATSVSWKQKGSTEYKTRTEWHRVICWSKLADWATSLQKGAYVESKGNCVTANILPRNPIAPCPSPKSMQARFWR
jgi:single-strand DNA-binding protein